MLYYTEYAYITNCNKPLLTVKSQTIHKNSQFIKCGKCGKLV